MNKISKLFCTGLALLSQSMCLVLGTSNIDNTQTAKHIEQSMISSEKDHKEESLAGTYVGSYTENGQTHGVSLEIVEANGVNYATFSFYPLSYSKSKASGSFFMNVEKNEDETYNFIQDKWVSRPGHYVMVDLLNCTVSNSTISRGELFTAQILTLMTPTQCKLETYLHLLLKKIYTDYIQVRFGIKMNIMILF